MNDRNQDDGGNKGQGKGTDEDVVITTPDNNNSSLLNDSSNLVTMVLNNKEASATSTKATPTENDAIPITAARRQHNESRVVLFSGPPVAENELVVRYDYEQTTGPAKVRPGAVRVAGIANQQQRRFYDEEKDEEQMQDNNLAITQHPRSSSLQVVAEVVDEGLFRDQMLREVDEDQLLRELLSRRGTNNNSNEIQMVHDVLSGNVVTVEPEALDNAEHVQNDKGDSGNESKTKHQVNALSRNALAAFAFAAAIVIAIVVTVVVVVVSQSKSNSSVAPTTAPSTHQGLLTRAPSTHQVSPTKAPSPTTAPSTHSELPTDAPTAALTRQDKFRLLFLNNNVSRRQDLFNQSSSQYQALHWIANVDQANFEYNVNGVGQNYH